MPKTCEYFNQLIYKQLYRVSRPNSSQKGTIFPVWERTGIIGHLRYSLTAVVGAMIAISGLQSEIL
jgi:hypothetical protein